MTYLYRYVILQERVVKKEKPDKPKTRNPYATSLNKVQYKKKIIPNKKRDVKPEIEHD